MIWCLGAPNAMVGSFRSPYQLKKLWKPQKVSKEFQAACLTRICNFGSAWTVTNYIGRYDLGLPILFLFLWLIWFRSWFSHIVLRVLLKRDLLRSTALLRSQKLFTYYIQLPILPLLELYPSTSNPWITCVSLLQGTQYHNAVQKFIDICKLNE